MANSKPVPAWLLERVVVDEIPAERRDEVARRLAADPDSAARLQELRESNQNILADIPAEQAVQEIERRHRIARIAAQQETASGPARRWALWTSGLAAAGAAVLLALVIRPGGGAGRGQELVDSGLDQADPLDPVGSIRLKGDPRLVLHRKRGEIIEKLAHESIAHPGDLIQISYSAAGASHGVILSIDGSGAVTLHYPVGPKATTRLEQRGIIQLAHSYELDDAPEFERFIFLTANHPIDLTTVLARARRLAAQVDQRPERLRSQDLDLAADIGQWSYVLDKESRP